MDVVRVILVPGRIGSADGGNITNIPILSFLGTFYGLAAYFPEFLICRIIGIISISKRNSHVVPYLLNRSGITKKCPIAEVLFKLANWVWRLAVFF